MTNSLNQQELIELVEKIMSAEGTEEEIDSMIETFKKNVPHPYASDLIFWSQNYGLGMDPTAEAIVTKALDYKPLRLS